MWKIVGVSKVSVKLWFTNMYFVGFYSVPNLIVILFNLLYLVFVVGIYCKGCVIVRESVKTQAIEAMRVFAAISWLSIPRKNACALHMTGMQRVSTDGDSCVSRVRPSRKTPARHSVLPDCTIWYTLSAPTLYIPTLPTNEKESLWEKTLAKTLES